MKVDNSSIAPHAPQPGLGADSWHEALMSLIRRGVAHIAYRRKVRRDLVRLLDFDDHTLRDIGLSRAEVLYLAGYGRLLAHRHDRRLLDQLGR
jgi:uncharacterized protein YjiS (DUF1127 family)